MFKEKISQNLKGIVSKLENKEESFSLQKFQVWDGNIPLVNKRVEPNAWSWGSCTSDTCRHSSHDPYCEGDVVTILCAKIGDDNGCIYLTEDGEVFNYIYSSNGHYSPTARIKVLGKKEEYLNHLKKAVEELQTASEFNTWGCGVDNWMRTSLVHYKEGSFNNGGCKSETCNHISHDSYSKGSTYIIKCEYIDSVDNYTYYKTPDGVIFYFETYDDDWRYEAGYISISSLSDFEERKNQKDQKEAEEKMERRKFAQAQRTKLTELGLTQGQANYVMREAGPARAVQAVEWTKYAWQTLKNSDILEVMLIGAGGENGFGRRRMDEVFSAVGLEGPKASENGYYRILKGALAVLPLLKNFHLEVKTEA